MTGVLLAMPPADFVLHNSLFLVAHFHNVIIGGVVFGAMAGYNYWFPKAFGFRLDERWGAAAFWCWLVGFYLAFMPLYALGLMGMTRRMQHYDDLAWRPWLIVAALGAVDHPGGDRLPDRAARRLDPQPRSAARLDRRSVERPHAGMVDAVAAAAVEFCRAAACHRDRRLLDHEAASKRATGGAPQQTAPARPPDYEPIEVPKNSPTGFVTAFFAVVTGFALIWHIWWMVIVGLVGAVATMLAFAWREQEEVEIPAEEVARVDREYRTELAA